MNKIRVAIIDDIVEEKEMLFKIVYTHFDGLRIASTLELFSRGSDFLNNFEVNKYDLIFLSIIKAPNNGIETARKIRELDHQVLIYFVTSSSAVVIESYEVRAFNYILKPYRAAKVKAILDQIVAKMDVKEEHHFIKVKVEGVIIEVNTSKIIYLESNNKKVVIHLLERDFEVYGKISNFVELFLPFKKFCRCHKSFIINMDYVKKIGGYEFLLSNEIMIPIPKPIFASIKKVYYEYLLGRA